MCKRSCARVWALEKALRPGFTVTLPTPFVRSVPCARDPRVRRPTNAERNAWWDSGAHTGLQSVRSCQRSAAATLPWLRSVAQQLPSPGCAKFPAFVCCCTRRWSARIHVAICYVAVCYAGISFGLH